MDKQSTERREYETPLDYVYKNMERESTTKVVEAMSEARVGVSPWEVHGNLWSAAVGAVIGAGTVLLIAAVILMWRKPRRQELPLLAPMDVAHSLTDTLRAAKAISKSGAEIKINTPVRRPAPAQRPRQAPTQALNQRPPFPPTRQAGAARRTEPARRPRPQQQPRQPPHLQQRPAPRR